MSRRKPSRLPPTGARAHDGQAPSAAQEGPQDEPQEASQEEPQEGPQEEPPAEGSAGLREGLGRTSFCSHGTGQSQAQNALPTSTMMATTAMNSSNGCSMTSFAPAMVSSAPSGHTAAIASMPKAEGVPAPMRNAKPATTNATNAAKTSARAFGKGNRACGTLFFAMAMPRLSPR